MPRRRSGSSTSPSGAATSRAGTLDRFAGRHRPQAGPRGQPQGGPAADAEVPQPACWRCRSTSRTSSSPNWKSGSPPTSSRPWRPAAYEVGVETVRADSLAIAGRETLYEHPGTGAVTELVEIVRRDKLDPLAADAALEIGARDPGPDACPGLKPRLVGQYPFSKRAAVVLPAPSRMFDDGGVQERVQPDPAGHPRPHGEGRARRLQLAQGRRGPLAHALGA